MEMVVLNALHNIGVGVPARPAVSWDEVTSCITKFKSSVEYLAFSAH